MPGCDTLNCSAEKEQEGVMETGEADKEQTDAKSMNKPKVSNLY